MRTEASQFWADTSLGYFEGMASGYQPEEKADWPEIRIARRALPPLAASQDVIAAIASCVPRRGKAELAFVPVHKASLAEVD